MENWGSKRGSAAVLTICSTFIGLSMRPVLVPLMNAIVQGAPSVGDRNYLVERANNLQTCVSMRQHIMSGTLLDLRTWRVGRDIIAASSRLSRESVRGCTVIFFCTTTIHMPVKPRAVDAAKLKNAADPLLAKYPLAVALREAHKIDKGRRLEALRISVVSEELCGRAPPPHRPTATNHD